MAPKRKAPKAGKIIDSVSESPKAEHARAPASEPIVHPQSLRVRARDLVVAVEYLATVQGWLGDGLTPRQCTTRACKPPPLGLSMSRDKAQRYVGAALLRLQQDAAQEPRESKLARSIATWQALFTKALERKRTFQQNGETITYDIPDLKAAATARHSLDLLEGLVSFDR